MPPPTEPISGALRPLGVKFVVPGLDNVRLLDDLLAHRHRLG